MSENPVDVLDEPAVTDTDGEAIWSDTEDKGDDAMLMTDNGQNGGHADEAGSALQGVESVPGYIPLSTKETAEAGDWSEESAMEGVPVDADYSDDPEFFRQFIRRLPRAIKVIKSGARLAGSVLGSPVGTAAASAAGSAFGVPPAVSAAVVQFLAKTASMREFGNRIESDDPSAVPSILEVVIGADDRVRINNTAVTPWSGICQLNITARNGQRFIGTGWLISPRCVITAGHCVYIRGAGGFASRIEVSPGRNGASLPFGSVVSSRFSALPRWVTHTDRNFDCGCIILPRPARSPNGATPFNYRYGVKSDAAIRARALNLSGYPGDKGGITQYFHARLAKGVSPTTITYDVDTAGGQSGSPVWHLENGVRTAIGIHTNGSPLGNSATRINAGVKLQMDKWRLAGL